jgi:Polyketide cyclase / dehydrase and lipid transport
MTTIWVSISLVFSVIGVSMAQSKNPPQVKISMIINRPVETTFDYIVPVKLSHIFKRHKRFPAIVETDETEKWYKGGLQRTVFFEDGTTAQESLLTVIPHQSFSYKIEKFTSSLRKLALKVEGDWQFKALENGQTKVEWTYKLIPKNGVTKTILNLFVLKDLKVLLTNSLTILKEDLESGAYKNEPE